MDEAGIKAMLNNANRFTFTPAQQFHTLKHFRAINEEFIRKHIRQFRNVESVSERLRKNVSKFNPGFADNPFTVLDQISNTGQYQVSFFRESRYKLELQLSFNPHDFPGGIGLSMLLPLKHLNSIQQNSVFKENGLQYCKDGPAPVKTWDLNLVLRKNGEQPEIITFFPGTFAPPVPDQAFQDPDQYNESLEFWGQHVILVS